MTLWAASLRDSLGDDLMKAPHRDQDALPTLNA